MNSSDFTFWLSGYVGDSATPPNQQQWDRIRENLSRVTGITRFDNALPHLKIDPNKNLCRDTNPQKSESWKSS